VASLVLLLDVDGVLNTFHDSWGAPLVRTHCAGQPIRYAPAMFERLRGIVNAGLVEVRWSTTWCGIRPQLAAMTDLLGIDATPAFGPHRPMAKTWGDLKLDAALAALGEGRRIVWADDDEEAAAGRRLCPKIAEAERDRRALLICPVSEYGLQPEHLDEIEAFAAEKTIGKLAA
jgi:hypothetical protein